MYLEIARAVRGEGVQRIPASKSLQVAGLASALVTFLTCNATKETGRATSLPTSR